MNADRLLSHFDRIADAPDAVPRLRRFILDLAVRGKLVEQDPNDGNGSSLLVEVERACAVRISSGKVKKQKVWGSPGFSDVPFEVPDNWALVRLGQSLELVNGSRIQTKATGHQRACQLFGSRTSIIQPHLSIAMKAK